MEMVWIDVTSFSTLILLTLNEATALLYVVLSSKREGRGGKASTLQERIFLPISGYPKNVCPKNTLPHSLYTYHYSEAQNEVIN